MNVLVACEESQRVCSEFRALGHNAFSCDVLDCSGGHPEWHIKGDVIPLIDGHCVFYTCDNVLHVIDDKWDMIIAFPPCTHLAVSGARHFEKKRLDGSQYNALIFFLKIYHADCDCICIENPVNILCGNYVNEHYPGLSLCFDFPFKPTQIIQPYFFGDRARKRTCLWLKNLPPLIPTNIVDFGEIVGDGYSVGASMNYAVDENGKILSWNNPLTAIIRSKTYPGVAFAMAQQWGRRECD